MAIVMETNYSKKIGLPGYSSHQYMITLRTELADLNQVEAESARLYTLLQTSVDREIQTVGFLPVNGKGNGNGHGNSNGSVNPPPHSNSHGNGNGNGSIGEGWACTPRQRQCILNLVAQHGLDKHTVEKLAQEQFGKSVRSLGKIEASGLIEELKARVASNGDVTQSRATQPA